METRILHLKLKVRTLEQANRVLEEQVAQLSLSKPSRLAEAYEDELNRFVLHENESTACKIVIDKQAYKITNCSGLDCDVKLTL